MEQASSSAAEPQKKRRRGEVDGLAKSRQILNGGSVTVYSGYSSTTTTPQQAGEKSTAGPSAARGNPSQLAGMAVQGLPRQLPEGWEMKKSRSTGKVYYVNEKLGKSQFDPPVGSTVKVEKKKKQRVVTHSKDLPDAQTTDKIGMMGVIRGNDKQAGRWNKWQRCSRILDDEDQE